MIAGNAGILVARVLYVKQGASKTFTIVDAAMNDLIRPTLYEAYHEIWPVIEPEPGMLPDRQRRGRPGVRDRRLSRAGPAAARASPGRSHCRDDRRRLWRGAASEYNSWLLVPEVLVAGDRYAVTRPRPQL